MSGKRDRAIEYCQGLTAQQLLDKLANQGINHPCILAQTLGLSGRGDKWEVASNIVNAINQRR